MIYSFMPSDGFLAQALLYISPKEIPGILTDIFFK